MSILQKKPLKEYIHALDEAGLIASIAASDQVCEHEVGFISYDSQDLKKDTLFVCKGAHFSSQYLMEALTHGAFAYLSEKRYPEADAPHLLVNEIRQSMAVIADLYYGQIWRKLTTIGITGTKGKSSTTYFVRSILDDFLREHGRQASAVISGIENYDGVIREESHLTTPEAMMLHRHFYHAVKSGIDYLTMEVSSQALKYDRTAGIVFDIGCFLNLGEDHISPVEHPTLEDYRNSKMILMRQCRTAVINQDSRYAVEAIKAAKDHAGKIITFGTSAQADICGYAIQPQHDGIRFRAKGERFDEEMSIGLTGMFNVSNALAAIAITEELGIPFKNIRHGLQTARVDGRMERFTNPDGTIIAIVDYAHNKMSFEALFQSVRQEYPGRKITIVFGCPGKKAQRRRKELGELAGEYCDRVILTEEDAGEEPVMEISREIAEYVRSSGHASVEIIEDRGEAIEEAVKSADENTVILLTGKGRETRQKRGTQYIDTPSDVEYVTRSLSKR